MSNIFWFTRSLALAIPFLIPKMLGMKGLRLKDVTTHRKDCNNSTPLFILRGFSLIEDPSFSLFASQGKYEWGALRYIKLLHRSDKANHEDPHGLLYEIASWGIPKLAKRTEIKRENRKIMHEPHILHAFSFILVIFSFKKWPFKNDQLHEDSSWFQTKHSFCKAALLHATHKAKLLFLVLTVRQGCLVCKP